MIFLGFKITNLERGICMRFTYQSYCEMLRKIISKNYLISNYSSFVKYNKVCILRHDIDYSIDKAVELSRVEENLNREFKNEEIHSTWFVLLTSDFYNVFSKDSVKKIREIMNGGGRSVFTLMKRDILMMRRILTKNI